MTRIYAYLAGAGVLLALAVGLVAWGHSRGREAQRKDDATLIARKDAALRNAAAALGSAAVRFREISAATKANKREADARRKAAEALASQAKAETRSLQNRIATLNQQAEYERATCAIAETPICGQPLR